MATSNRIRALNRLPFDFEDGLKVGGVDVTSLNQAFTPAGAGLIGFTPVGGLAAGNVQAALAELDSEKAVKTDLAATTGSSLVGYDGGTVQDVMDSAKPMADYVALRAYTGRATSVRITKNGISGFFYRDDADTTSADNGGTIIVASNGKRWKRVYSGAVNVKWFGAKGDWNGSTGTDDTAAIQAAINWLASIGKSNLYIPAGKYRITGLGLNLTVGKISIFGDGSGDNGSVLIGETGENFVLDYTGSTRWVTIQDIEIESVTATGNPSVNGILFARTNALTLNGEHNFTRLRIRLISSPTANGGMGSVAFTSIGTESCDFISAYFRADVAYFAGSLPAYSEFINSALVTYKTITSNFATIDPAAASNSENYLNGVFLSMSGTRPAIWLRNAASYQMNIFVSRLVIPDASTEPPATAPSAIFLDNTNGIKITGDVEGYRIPVSMYGFNRDHCIDLYHVYAVGYPLINSKQREAGASNTLLRCNVKITPTLTSSTNAATFILDNTRTDIFGGRIELACALALTNVNSRIRGVDFVNPENYAITTNGTQTESNHSTYTNRQADVVSYVGRTLKRTSGNGYTEVEFPFYLSTLTNSPSPNSRITQTFIADSNYGVVFCKLTMTAQGDNANPIYLDRVLCFSRPIPTAAYTLTGSVDTAFFDSTSQLSQITITPVITSATGSALQFYLEVSIGASTRPVNHVSGKVSISGRWAS